MTLPCRLFGSYNGAVDLAVACGETSHDRSMSCVFGVYMVCHEPRLRSLFSSLLARLTSSLWASSSTRPLKRGSLQS